MRIILALLISTALFGETKPAVIGMMNDIHATANLDKTVAFYRDVLGLTVGDPRPFPNTAVPLLVNAPGVKLRIATFKIPGGFGFELTEFTGVDHKTAQPRHYDPGSANLLLRVRDIEPVLAAIKKSGTRIATRSGAPVNMNPTTRAIIVADPDDYLVEVMQSPAPADAPSGNIIGAAMGITVGDMDANLRFYRDVLGFDLKIGADFTDSDTFQNVAGAPKGGKMRLVQGVVPGTNVRILFSEFKGMPQTPVNLRVTDPGSPAMSLQVNDLDGLLQKIKAMGLKVVSANGEKVQFSPTIHNAFVEDPNGVKIELYQNER